MDRLYAGGKLTKTPFDEPIEYLYFDMWHYDGRTARHGAFMGGADFVQRHGAYQLTAKLTELRAAPLQNLRQPARGSLNRTARFARAQADIAGVLAPTSSAISIARG